MNYSSPSPGNFNVSTSMHFEFSVSIIDRQLKQNICLIKYYSNSCDIFTLHARSPKSSYYTKISRYCCFTENITNTIHMFTLLAMFPYWKQPTNSNQVLVTHNLSVRR